ncbi:hypothetical protein [Carboxylicivirga marina]|uniref:Serine endopeptidase n=1 Tax=Carboxylicivirga marina TaxID=2800988 RepID=A0ABS1HES9_9BACT|nr:hypothetical protein [Carboxylicivirga marina]MBK3515818.1 hypothetical protein [Carboxylicivirga marina]
MKIKRNYSKPDLEEHLNDLQSCLFMFSDPITDPDGGGLKSMEVPPASAPPFENPSAADYPFGGDSPDYTDM